MVDRVEVSVSDALVEALVVAEVLGELDALEVRLVDALEVTVDTALLEAVLETDDVWVDSLQLRNSE